ncbi:MAG: DNA polymerase III subunit delta' [Cyanobacteria bacterium P01_D01_bin.73]
MGKAATGVISPWFVSLLGQDQAVVLLERAIARDHVAPAYLFAGPDGVGRGLAARCFAQLLFSPSGNSSPSPRLAKRIQEGNHPDLLWVEPTYTEKGKLIPASQAAEAGVKTRTAPQIRLEQVRQIGQFLGRQPLEAARSLVVLESAETMGEGAANGLLKTLEEPGQATIILLAPSADALLPTLVSRCARIPFRRLSLPEVQTVLRQAGRDDVASQGEVLTLAQGSPGAAIAHWENLQGLSEELRAALDRPVTNTVEALTLAKQITKELTTDAQIWLVTYLQHRYWSAMSTTNGGAIAPADSTTSPMHLFEQARQLLRGYVQPRLVWEVTLMKLRSKG